MDQEALKVVASDLDFLQSEWDQEVDDDSLRRSSPVIRRLLVEEDLRGAWKELGKAEEPVVEAPDLEYLLTEFPPNEVAYAQAGGATYHGIQVSAPIELKKALGPIEALKLAGLGPGPPSKPFTITDLMRSVCVVVKGTSVSRSELIRYVANKLGGAHYDPSRTAKKPGPKELQRKFTLLDGVRETTEIAGKNAVYYELLSIGQCLLRAPDINELRSELNEVLR